MAAVCTTRFCPSCEREVELELYCERDYAIQVCSHCGLGLGLCVGTRPPLKQMSIAPCPAPQSVETPAASIAQGGASTEAEAASVFGTVNPALIASSHVAGSSKNSLSTASSSVALASSNTGGATPALRSLASREKQTPNDSLDRDLHAESSPAPSSSTASSALRVMRCVILADRDDALRMVTQTRLLDRNRAKEVFEMPSGGRAVEAFMRIAVEGSRPDLVVTSLSLDDMTGVELAFALRAIEKGIGCSTTPILFYADTTLTDDLKATLKAIGLARFVRKPEGDAQALSIKLLSVIERLLAEPKA